MVTKKRSDVRKYTPEDIVEYNMCMGNYIGTYDKISMLRSVGGVVCIAVGIGTWVVPFTTAPLIMFGSWLLGYDSKIWLPKAIYKAKLLCRWIYCNRTPKKMMRTIKQRVLVWN